MRHFGFQLYVPYIRVSVSSSAVCVIDDDSDFGQARRRWKSKMSQTLRFTLQGEGEYALKSETHTEKANDNKGAKPRKGNDNKRRSLSTYCISPRER